MKTDPEMINSFKNPKVQYVRELISNRSARAESGLFVAEGVRLAEEAFTRGIQPRFILYSSRVSIRGEQLIQHFRENQVEVSGVHADTLDRLSDTETSQGILLVLPMDLVPLPAGAEPVLIIDQLRDPGNLGTILRSAAAAGVEAVFIAPGSVDPFMPKVVRAGMGAHFHLPIRLATWPEITAYCKQRPIQLTVLLADADSDMTMWQANLTLPLALIIGSEAEGAGLEARELADDSIRIPMPGGFESLNAGVAASILLYEVLRQRNL